MIQGELGLSIISIIWDILEVFHISNRETNPEKVNKFKKLMETKGFHFGGKKQCL